MNTISKNMKLKLAQFCHFMIVLAVMLMFVSTNSQDQDQSEVFTLKTVIETNMKLTKSLAVSPLDTQVIVGGRDGILKVFNYESGQKIWEDNQKSSQITTILWENIHQGLIIVSVDHKDNTSLAVQRKSNNFEQVHRWQFTEFVYNADSVSNRHDSYIAFNFMTHVEQYNLKTRKKSTTYQPTQNRLFVEMRYSSNYNYLYLSGNGQYMYAFKCGTIYRFYYGTSDVISSFEADRANNQHAPVIYKKQYTGFQVLDPNYQFNASFPKQKMNFYKYCPKDFILGVGIDETITIFSRDYKFTQQGVIKTFVDRDFFIVQIVCQNDRIIVTASNNNIYVFQLEMKQSKPSEGWIWVVAIGGFVTFILILVSVCVVKKARKDKANKKIVSPSLLSSEPKSSVVSELII